MQIKVKFMEKDPKVGEDFLGPSKLIMDEMLQKASARCQHTTVEPHYAAHC